MFDHIGENCAGCKAKTPLYTIKVCTGSPYSASPSFVEIGCKYTNYLKTSKEKQEKIAFFVQTGLCNKRPSA